MNGKLKEILSERGSRYGDFDGNAKVSQGLQDILTEASNKSSHVFYPYHYEALYMICHKLGRIVNGDPGHADSWQDIAGYAQLVVNIIEGETRHGG